MNEFEASNGERIARKGLASLVIERPGTDRMLHINADRTDALREFFRAERDEELGRWRSRSNPSIWVMADTDDPNRILLVSEPLQTFAVYRRSPNGNVSGDNDGWGGAIAHDYFDAHPERKPWEDAKEGEVWIITPSKAITLGEHVEYPAIFQAGEFRDHGGSWRAEDITAACRIWPEEAS